MTVSADWQGFAEVLGAASGALTGLLFVSVSLNASRIARHPGLRASAGQTLVLFVTPLIMALVVLTPDQPDWVLGAELIAIGLAASAVLLSIGRPIRGLAYEDLRLISIFNRRSSNVIVMLMLVASGIILASGVNAGLYLLPPASLIELISGLLNAWHFLLPPADRSLWRRTSSTAVMSCKVCFVPYGPNATSGAARTVRVCEDAPRRRSASGTRHPGQSPHSAPARPRRARS